MAFLLARGEAAIATEVQRWQHFLRRIGFTEVGGVDGDFGQNTERATRRFQNVAAVPETGRLDARTLKAAVQRGYAAAADTHYESDPAAERPSAAVLAPPSSAWRNATLTAFRFRKPHDEGDDILIQGDCDGATSDWIASHIVTISVPQLEGLAGPTGKLRVHALAAPKLAALFRAWEEAGLMHLVLTWEGCFAARYLRPKEGEASVRAHGARCSREVSTLSNHAFGSAFDINASWNRLGHPPAPMGAKGCVRELVPIAIKHGFFWGGHFSTRPDGMHFELARL